MIAGNDDFVAITLTLRLALIVTLLLLFVATPLAWWLAYTNSRWRNLVSALVAMPLVLPPTVLGFYLLVAMGPDGLIGQLTDFLGLQALPFTFSGLVIASMIYSLPFAVQPLQNAFENMGKRPLEVAATLRSGPLDRFLSVVLPLTKGGFVTAMILCFTHTLGEFGLVLMIGGNIPGETRVISMQIYEHVETLNYRHAHFLSALMLFFSFSVLLCLSGSKKRFSFLKRDSRNGS